MCFKYSLKLDIKRITIKIKMKLAVKVFITYLVRLWTNATEFFLSLTDLLTATYSYMCLVVPPWEWYLWCGVTACWDLFSEYRFCWFLTSVLSCEGYICYFMCPSQVVYTWSWIFKFWWCVYIQFLMTLLSCCSSSVSAHWMSTDIPEDHVVSIFRRRRHVPLKCQFTFNRLHSIMSQKIEFFVLFYISMEEFKY